MSTSSSNGQHALSLFHVLSEQVMRVPERAAIAAPGRSPMTYRHLLQRLRRMQDALHGLGIGRHDRVALALPPGPELAVALLGVASTATCVPMHPADASMEDHLSDLHVKAMILPLGEKNKAHTTLHRQGIPVLELIPVPDTDAGFFALTGHTHLTSAVQELPHDDDLALILPPSDTEPYAQPIGLTHAHLCLAAWQVAARLKLDMSDSCLSIVPPFQSDGLVAGLLASLMVGANVVCPPAFHADAFFQWLDACRPSWYTADPSMHEAIVSDAPQYAEQIRRCPLRFIRSASDALSPRVTRALERIFRAPVMDAHGTAEVLGQLGEPYGCNNTLSVPRREAWATASLASVRG
jgi:acyl-CoA synthetase (AMP-forming)/AMP-acid ligase II